MLSCDQGSRGTHGNSVMKVFLLCVHSLPGTHVCHVHTDTRKRYNTLHALFCFIPALLTVLSKPSDKAVLYSTSHFVSVSLHISVLSLLSVSSLFVFTLRYGDSKQNFATSLIIHKDCELASFSNSPLWSPLSSFFFLCGIVVTAEKNLQASVWLRCPKQSWQGSV